MCVCVVLFVHFVLTFYYLCVFVFFGNFLHMFLFVSTAATKFITKTIAKYQLKCLTHFFIISAVCALVR